MLTEGIQQRLAIQPLVWLLAHLPNLIGNNPWVSDHIIDDRSGDKEF
jgi:hypothetical protein